MALGLGACIRRDSYVLDAIGAAWTECEALSHRSLFREEGKPFAAHFAKDEYLAIARAATEQAGSLKHEPWAASEVEPPDPKFGAP